MVLEGVNPSMPNLSPIQSPLAKLEQIMQPDRVFCKEDIIWVLDYIKKKVAERDPALLSLSQPRLLENFRCFAEVSMMIIHHRSVCSQEVEMLKSWIAEAAYGFVEDPCQRQQ
jgi:hypothetical protein